MARSAAGNPAHAGEEGTKRNALIGGRLRNKMTKRIIVSGDLKTKCLNTPLNFRYEVAWKTK